MLDFFDPAFWQPVGMAVLCGGLLGLERQLRGKPAGMRTSILICLGTVVFMRFGVLLSQDGGGDHGRTLGQVVTGIGFLGGGVILSQGGLVRGMTSASVIWLLAAVGVAIGLEHYRDAFALTMTAAFVLIGVQRLERLFPQLRRGVHSHELDGRGSSDGQ